MRRRRQILSHLNTEGGRPFASLSVLHAAGTAAEVHQAQAGSASQVDFDLYLSLQSTAGPAQPRTDWTTERVIATAAHDSRATDLPGGLGGLGGLGGGGGGGGSGAGGGAGGGAELQHVWHGPVQKKQQPVVVCAVATGWLQRVATRRRRRIRSARKKGRNNLCALGRSGEDGGSSHLAGHLSWAQDLGTAVRRARERARKQGWRCGRVGVDGQRLAAPTAVRGGLDDIASSRCTAD
eukprot:SAG31_NODE_526_length_14475_cov_5.135197_12_plen_237_part_00